MYIRWAAPPLAKQIPMHVAYARSAKAGAPIYADEEVRIHAQWRRQKIAAQTGDKNKLKMARISHPSSAIIQRFFLEIG
jgi:hypothetical protein